MNKISKIACVLLGLVAGANAQLKGVGYDTDLKEVTGRFELGANFIDAGFGMKFDSKQDSSYAKFQMSASAFFLGHLHDFGPVDTYFTAGGIFAKLPQSKDNITISAFAGFQPEVTLLDHIVLSTRFGLDIPLSPSFVMQTAGSGVSIVGGGNFKILF